MSSPKRTIAVLGATGTQGGGVVRSLLKDGEFDVRAVTRNPDSASAKEIKALGAEVVRADVNNTASLIAAFNGAYGVFGVTDFWGLFFANNFDQAKTEAEEAQQGKNVVDACKAARIEHLVWSTLPHVDGLHIYHFESKAQVNEYLASSGVPYTNIYTAFYYNNLTLNGFEMLKEQEDGSFILTFGIPSDIKMHFFDGSEMGQWVVPTFKNPEKYLGGHLFAVSELLTPREFRETVERVTGKKTILPEVTVEQFYTPEFRENVGDEIWLNFDGWVQNKLSMNFDVSRELNPNPVTLETYLKTNPKVRKLMRLDEPPTVEVTAGINK